MKNPRSRSTLVALLAVALIVLAWVIVRVLTTTPDAASPGTRIGATTAGPTFTTPSGPSNSPEATDPASGLPWVKESVLPNEARDTLRLIRAGGPYPYPRNDDQTFRNSEGLLPRHSNGYYREYTVKTPGSSDRGARRIITGAPDEKYWTDDHYDSFSRIREGS